MKEKRDGLGQKGAVGLGVVILIVIIVIIILGGGWYWMYQKNSSGEAENGGTVEAGTTSLETEDLPEPPETPDVPVEGATEEPPLTPAGTTTNTVTNTNITVTEPTTGQSVEGDELTITGQARGTWYFEASFPATLLDQNGNELLREGIQTTASNWMTTDFIPFEATIDLSGISYTGPATLVLHKANPSGLPEHASSTSVSLVIE